MSSHSDISKSRATRLYSVHVAGSDGWSVGGLVGWSVGRLVGWSVGRLVGWSVVRLVGFSVGQLAGFSHLFHVFLFFHSFYEVEKVKKNVTRFLLIAHRLVSYHDIALLFSAILCRFTDG